MAAPSFLNTSFAFTTLAGVVDVQTIMDAIQTMLTATLPATPTTVFPSGERWTSPSANVYKSPVDQTGRFMQITLARTTAVRMGFKIEDPTGTIVDGEIDIAVAGSMVNIFGGPAHLWVEANNAGTWETARAVMTDPTPEPLDASTVYVWCATHRTAAGGVAGNGAIYDYWGGRYTGGTVTGTSYYIALARVHMPLQDSSGTHLRTEAGSDCAAPAYMMSESSVNADTCLNAGKLYQAVLVDSNQVPGVDLNIPIDTGVTGQFRVAHLGNNGTMALFALRKG